jgi:plastocyanin
MFRFARLAAWIAIFGCAVSAAQSGEIRGRVVVSRGLTKKRVTVPDYALQAPTKEAESDAGGAIPLAAEYKRLVVYLEGSGERKLPSAAVNLFQRDRQFEPEVIAVPVGSTVSFPNDDPIFHNVFSLSPAQQFDLGYYPAGDTRTIRFDRPGVVQVYCHLHSDMSAAIVVVPTSWFARPEPPGDFSFRGLPAGRYKLVVWHKSAGFFQRTVELRDEEIADVQIEIPILKGSAP